MKHRIEKDTLGEVRVPEDALFGAQTQRAIENFPISGLTLPRRFIRAQGIIKLAAARANRRAGALDEKLAAAIEQAAQEVVDGVHDSHFRVDVFQAGAGTSQNMNANEVIANRANEILGGARGDLSLCGPNDHVNMAQSTNDTIPCAIHISAAEAVRHDLLSAVAALHKTLAKKANEFMPVVKSGRTHLQDAVPIRLGQEFAAWASAVKRDISRIEHAAQTLLELPLGGNAVGTGINAHPKYRACAIKEIARITKMPFRPMENMFEGIQNVVGALELSAALRGLAVTLSRIANDVRLLASGPRTGLAELLLPAVQPGSSIMPGKVNPVMSEMLNMVCIQVAGNDAAVSMAAQSGQLELNVMMPVMAHNLLQSITILANGASAFNARCLAGLKADKKQCSHWMGRSLAIATALNPAIGYHKAAAVSKRAHAENKTVLEVVVEQGILPEAEARKLLDAEKLV